VQRVRRGEGRRRLSCTGLAFNFNLNFNFHLKTFPAPKPKNRSAAAAVGVKKGRRALFFGLDGFFRCADGGFFALQVSDAAFLFDDLVVLFAHGLKCEGRKTGESQTGSQARGHGAPESP
jgi:hypothetical protein